METGLDEKTVRQIFHDFRERQKDTLSFITPRILGIDELYMQKQYRCVMTDLEGRSVIELLPSRAKDLVSASISRWKGG